MTTNAHGAPGSPSEVPILPNETERIAALHSYHILDTAEEKDFDDLTELASFICQTPVALVSLVDTDRQWFKSHKGTEVTQTPKSYSFCAHAIASPAPFLVVNDAGKDERFATNPLVTGDPHIAFYAGVPLINKEGFALGSLCVIDTEVRELTEAQINALMAVANHVVDKLELRRKVIQLENSNQKLFESENRFRRLVSQAPVAIAIYSGPELIIEQANDAMLQLWGRSVEIIGKPLLTARPEIADNAFVGTLNGILETGTEQIGVAIKAPVYRNGVAEERYFDATYKPLKDDDGKVTGVMAIATDVTERVLARQTELEMNEELAVINEELTSSNEELSLSRQYLIDVNNELRESEGRFRNLIEQAPVAIATMKGRELVIDCVNDAILKIWGKDRSVVGKPIHAALPELEGQPFFQILDDVITTGKPYYGNEAKITLDYNGTLTDLYVNFVYQPIKGKDGATAEVMVVATNVTEQVDARKAVDETNQRLQIALDASALGSTEVDLATGKMTSTEQFKKNYGYAKDEEFNYPDLFNAMFPEYREEIKQRVGFAIANKTVYKAEYPVSWPDGSIHWISAHGRARYNDEGKADRMVGMTSDITAQVAARKQLEEAEERFRLIADNIAQLAWMADGNGYIFWYNKRWFDYTGTTLDEMKGSGWVNAQHPDHVDRVVEKYNHDISKGVLWEDTFPLRSAEGEYRWFLSRAVPAKNEEGAVISWFGTNTDITEQRLLEQRKDDFLSIASHELKTPITSLKASLQLLNLIKDRPNSPMHIRLIEQSNKSMEKMSVLVEDLLNVNRLTDGYLDLDKTTFTIAEMLNGCCNHIRMAGKHQLVLQGDEQLQVFADEHRIDQVVVNFVNNAVKYSPDSKEIYLVIEKLDGYAKIAVKDKGPGIAKENQPYLFDRYYRADHSGLSYSGLGLGLYICSEIIKRHGGEIGVDSEIGKGSTFWFTLPL